MDLTTLCRLTFIDKFNSFDGIYRLVHITRYEYSEEVKANIFDSMYSPLDLTPADFNADFENIVASEVLTVEELTTDTSKTPTRYYFSEYFLRYSIDHTIKKYNNFSLGINLGLFESENDQRLKLIKTEVESLIKDTLGNETKALVFVNKTKYLSDSEYKNYDENRTLEKYTTTLTKLKEAEKKISTMANTIKKYEAIVVKFNIQGDDSE